MFRRFCRLLKTDVPTLTVNGQTRDHQAEPDTPLLWVLREHLGLTGTRYGHMELARERPGRRRVIATALNRVLPVVLILALLAACTPAQPLQQTASVNPTAEAARLSGRQFMSHSTQALQDDDAQKPAFLWVRDGAGVARPGIDVPLPEVPMTTTWITDQVVWITGAANSRRTASAWCASSAAGAA